MSRPAISAIVPTFNRAAYLREAVVSILEQSVGDFELLIVDDCSSDETPAVVNELCRQDPRVVGLRTETNGGCNRARNLCLDRARGGVIAFLDDDDVALPGRFELGLAALAAEPSSGFASCGYRFIDAAGMELPGTPLGINSGLFEGQADRLFEMLYCDWLWLPTSTLMFRSSTISGHRYPEIRRSDGDSVFLSQLVAKGLVGVRVPETGTLMRRDVSYPTMSRDRKTLFAARRETLYLLQAWLRDQGIVRFDHLHGRAWANHLIREAEYQGGWYGVVRALDALRRDPSNRAARDYFRKRVGRRLVTSH